MNIVLTGASRGIGYQLALEYCKNPAHKVLAISRNKQNLDKLSEEKANKNLPGELITIPYDIKNIEKNSKELFGLISGYLNHVHILVNNAGKLINKSFENMKPEDAKEIFEVNFFSPSFLIQSLKPLMGVKDFTHILNISSMGGFQGSAKFPGLSYYSASKAAISILSECLAEEFKSENIYVNCLAPGAVQTEMLNEAFPGYQAPVNAKEMAKFIADFSEKGYKYFNGKILPVSLSTP